MIKGFFGTFFGNFWIFGFFGFFPPFSFFYHFWTTWHNRGLVTAANTANEKQAFSGTNLFFEFQENKTVIQTFDKVEEICVEQKFA